MLASNQVSEVTESRCICFANASLIICNHDGINTLSGRSHVTVCSILHSSCIQHLKVLSSTRTDRVASIISLLCHSSFCMCLVVYPFRPPYSLGSKLRGGSCVFLIYLAHQTATLVQYRPLTSERRNSDCKKAVACNWVLLLDISLGS